MKVRSYRKYKKAVKKAGAKRVATREEYGIIQRRLRQRYGKDIKTARTSAIEKALKRAGLTQEEISRLRGRK